MTQATHIGLKPNSGPNTGQSDSWIASLDLEYSARPDKTVISRRKHHGPLVIQKPFYPEGPVCHTILIHPPGGIVGGDRVNLDAQLNKGTHALISTPAATKFYRSGGAEAHLSQNFHVAGQSTLEWLPQENIAFDRCAVKASTHVHMRGNARFLGWEITCLGRPAGGPLFKQGHYKQSLQLFHEQTPVYIERNIFEGGDLLHQPWGLNNFYCNATFIAYPATETLLQAARNVVMDSGTGIAAITLIEQTLVCRVLSHQAEQARHYLIEVWKTLRPLMLSRPACEPRIWAT